ncbi:hypothetical protein GWI33_014290 [Rhynchophorus ferrugineus]|uniref:Uncharacterized protein n=1 Tax=Rhynchophorus ferrugineus TaxID=354439 RepID=A0A834IFE0_RHYFE|nr:hypothetical protein GWI33_014290 [Rhynchophorus ferrugineus]
MPVAQHAHKSDELAPPPESRATLPPVWNFPKRDGRGLDLIWTGSTSVRSSELIRFPVILNKARGVAASPLYDATVQSTAVSKVAVASAPSVATRIRQGALPGSKVQENAPFSVSVSSSDRPESLLVNYGNSSGFFVVVLNEIPTEKCFNRSMAEFGSVKTELYDEISVTNAISRLIFQ